MKSPWITEIQINTVRIFCRKAHEACRSAEAKLASLDIVDERRNRQVAAVANLVDARLKLASAVDRLEELAKRDRQQR